MSKTVWRLMVWDVPDRLTGLTARLGFGATKKNPSNWWRTFDPAIDKAKAVMIREALLNAGLKGSWQRLESRELSRAALSSPDRSFKAMQERNRIAKQRLAADAQEHAYQVARRAREVGL
jgi:hypothetical protein